MNITTEKIIKREEKGEGKKSKRRSRERAGELSKWRVSENKT